MGHKPEEEEINILQMVLVYLGYVMMYSCGYMWELWAKLVALVTGKRAPYVIPTPEVKNFCIFTAIFIYLVLYSCYSYAHQCIL